MTEKRLLDFLKTLPKQHGVFRQLPEREAFEEAYLQVRQLEGRVFDDETVRGLPVLPNGHPLAAEWKLRKKTLDRFLLWAKKNQKPGGIWLDMGCGNGWFLNRLAAEIPNQHFVGMEVNLTELEQAARVFPGRARHWLHADVFAPEIPRGIFDHITVNACVQYFPDFQRIAQRLLELLRPGGGAVHFLDSPFYKTLGAAAAAKNRTAAYFQKLGAPAAADYYFHRSMGDLAGFDFEVAWEPPGGWRKVVFGVGESPFPWVVLRQKHA